MVNSTLLAITIRVHILSAFAHNSIKTRFAT